LALLLVVVLLPLSGMENGDGIVRGGGVGEGSGDSVVVLAALALSALSAAAPVAVVVAVVPEGESALPSASVPGTTIALVPPLRKGGGGGFLGGVRLPCLLPVALTELVL
jgi:hypothetical protein